MHLINSQLVCADYEKDYPKISHAKGIYYYDTNGKKYIDGSGATATVTNIGHGVEEIADAMAQQAKKVAVHPAHLFHNEEIEDYFKHLCEFAPEGFNHAWTISGGTAAVENAVKLAYQYQKAKGRQRKKVLARWGSYHGNSVFNLDFGGNKIRRDFYSDLCNSDEHPHLSPCFPYRRDANMTEAQYEDSLINEFEETCKSYKDDIICFVAEPVVGAALGAVAPTQNYFKRIKEICEREDILFIADEVMTGFGRTGKAFAMEHFGVNADIMALAKGISSGYIPLGAVMAQDHVVETIRKSGKPFLSGQTYSCIPVAAAVGNAVLKYIKDNNIVENANKVGQYLKEKLFSLDKYDFVGDVRGMGLFLSVEFVKDKNSKEPLEQEYNFAKKLEAKCMEEGLTIYGCRGSYQLTGGDHLLLSPPLILTESQADEIYEILDKSIQDTINDYQKWLQTRS